MDWQYIFVGGVDKYQSANINWHQLPPLVQIHPVFCHQHWQNNLSTKYK
jgi:hypothetical protein